MYVCINVNLYITTILLYLDWIIATTKKNFIRLRLNNSHIILLIAFCVYTYMYLIMFVSFCMKLKTSFIRTNESIVISWSSLSNVSAINVNISEDLLVFFFVFAFYLYFFYRNIAYFSLMRIGITKNYEYFNKVEKKHLCLFIFLFLSFFLLSN